MDVGAMRLAETPTETEIDEVTQVTATPAHPPPQRKSAPDLLPISFVYRPRAQASRSPTQRKVENRNLACKKPTLPNTMSFGEAQGVGADTLRNKGFEIGIRIVLPQPLQKKQTSTHASDA